MYDGIVGQNLIGMDEKPPSCAERAAKACKSSGLDTDNQARRMIGSKMKSFSLAMTTMPLKRLWFEECP